MRDVTDVPAGGPPSDPVLLARYVDLAFRAHDSRRLEQALPILKDRLPDLPDLALARLVGLARLIDDIDLTAGLFDEVARRDRISPFLANAVMRWACAMGDDAQVARVQESLQRRVAAANGMSFALQSTRLRLGPEAARHLARQQLPRATDAETAVQVAEAAKHSGHARLASRYLRLCARRWPHSAQIRSALVSAHMLAGDIDAAHAFVDSLGPQCSPPERFRLRLSVLTQSGDLDGAIKLLDDAASLDRRNENPLERLRISIALGELDAARDALARVDRIDRAHFRPGHMGAMMTELELTRRIVPSVSQPSADLVASFYEPARRVVAQWSDRNQRRAISEPSLTRTIFQYWDKPDIPGPVAAIMESWQNVDGWAYRSFDRSSATAWLKETLDDEHARAFRLASQPAQECDFLRLCLLLAEGGLYVDADDKLIGSPDSLLAGTSGAVVFREAYGALANNVIYSPPDHPMLRIAVDLARRSLLARENDSTWAKTGPGLLTRAAACHLMAQGENGTDSLTILPQQRMRAHVHPHIPMPYKLTGAYWNASIARIPEAVGRALNNLSTVDELTGNALHP